MANNGPSFTKATYDKKRTPGPVPSPGGRQEAQAAFAAKVRAIRKLGLAVGLGLIKSKPPEPPLRRI